MRFVRQLVRNGNATQITIPKALVMFLRWQTGDPMVVDLTERGTMEVRRATPADLQGARVGPMTLNETIPDSLR